MVVIMSATLEGPAPLSALEYYRLVRERIEHEDLGAGTHEKFLKIADDLCRRYGLAVPAAAEPALSCCHHHKTA